ncbi:MAG: hypothetical protein ACXWJM_15130, partial [Ramlibacter sp.]
MKTHLRSWVAPHGKPITTARGPVESRGTTGVPQLPNIRAMRELLSRWRLTHTVETQEEPCALLADCFRHIRAHDEPILHAVSGAFMTSLGSKFGLAVLAAALAGA